MRAPRKISEKITASDAQNGSSANLAATERGLKKSRGKAGDKKASLDALLCSHFFLISSLLALQSLLFRYKY